MKISSERKMIAIFFVILEIKAIRSEWEVFDVAYIILKIYSKWVEDIKAEN